MSTISVRRDVVVLCLCVGIELQLTLSFPASYPTCTLTTDTGTRV